MNDSDPAVDRRAIERHRHPRRIAAARQTAHVDVRTGHAAGAFGPDAGNEREDFGRALGRNAFQRGFVDGGDGVGRILLAHARAAGGTDHDDGIGIVDGFEAAASCGAAASWACAAFATSASAIAPAATPERAMPFMESLMHLSLIIAFAASA
jgi:hypothetical protein